MKRPFDLSLRHKIPFWGASLILLSITAVVVALMGRAYDDMKTALLISADNLGRTLATTLAPPLLHDDVWRAFEIVRSPIRASEVATPVQAEAAVVLNSEGRIFVASDPDALPMLTDAGALGRDWRELAARIGDAGGSSGSVVVEPTDSAYLYVALPITDNDARLGHLVLRYDRAVFYPWFRDTALRGLIIGLLALAVLIPINWYWGVRMARPLVALAARMGRMPATLPEHLEPGLYPYHDELGELFLAYNRMVQALREKSVLEGEMVKSERLAAIGRLSAGIAHEINNPLAGLVTAVDTLKQRRDLDPRVQRHLDLIERGLMQIRDTVAALLVQTRAQPRPLNAQDLEDVRTLIQPQVSKRRIALDWQVDMPESLPVPASLVRQILINLLLNAVQAAGEGGRVWLRFSGKESSSGQLFLLVRNGGEQLSDEQLAHLFEPFASTREGGHGLGLWVTYQIVTQLGGRISAANADGEVLFSVCLPLGATPCNTASA